jgi:hypothetical protein
MTLTKEQWNPIITKAQDLLKKGFKIMNRGEEIDFHLDDLTDTEKRLYSEKEDVELEIHYTKENGITYYPLGVRHFPGVYRYPDGSGEPPSADTYELGDVDGYDKATVAIEQMMHECHMFHWRQISEVFYEQIYCNQDEIDKELYGDTILNTQE